MARQSDPMQELRRRLYRLGSTNGANSDRIRAAMLIAMIDGADKTEIEQMARAVGLHLERPADAGD